VIYLVGISEKIRR